MLSSLQETVQIDQTLGSEIKAARVMPVLSDDQISILEASLAAQKEVDL